jgi:hypothetical protein
MTTFGDMVYHMGGMPVNGFFAPGRPIFVRPYTGSDSHNGKKPGGAVKTLVQALAMGTADKGDVVYMIAESNTAAYTTDYQSTALNWNKDGLHLIGVGAGTLMSQRSRIAQLSTATNVDNLFTVSADNCYIANIQVFHGVNDATSVGAVLVSGSRNHFYRCHFAGIGHDTQDVADNYSLSISGQENLFEECVIGIDTIARGSAANYEILSTTGSTRNVFKNCIIQGWCESANNYNWVKVTYVDRYMLFDNCVFINGYAGSVAGFDSTVAIAEGFNLSAGLNGFVVLKDCAHMGATTLEANAGATSRLLTNMPARGSIDVTSGQLLEAAT